MHFRYKFLFLLPLFFSNGHIWTFSIDSWEQYWSFVRAGCVHRVHTEWHRPISGVHSIMMENQPWLVIVGGAHAPTPCHSIYYHVQSCSVRSSWEGRYIPSISSLLLYVLCGCLFSTCEYKSVSAGCIPWRKNCANNYGESSQSWPVQWKTGALTYSICKQRRMQSPLAILFLNHFVEIPRRNYHYLLLISLGNSRFTVNLPIRGFQRDVLYLGWPIAPFDMSPNVERRGGAGSLPMSTAVHINPNKFWRSYSIYNLQYSSIFWDQVFMTTRGF